MFGLVQTKLNRSEFGHMGPNRTNRLDFRRLGWFKPDQIVQNLDTAQKPNNLVLFETLKIRLSDYNYRLKSELFDNQTNNLSAEIRTFGFRCSTVFRTIKTKTQFQVSGELA